MRRFERSQERTRLIDRFLKFALGCRIGDDPAARLNVRDAVLDDHGSKRDAGVEVARKVQIQDAAGVNPASRALELLDDFHGAHLRPAGKQAIKASKQSTSSRRRPRKLETRCIT